jgi:hypothetical protein
VKRHQEYAGYNTDPVGAGGDRSGYGQDRGKMPVFDEVVLRQLNIINPVVLAPCDLLKDFAVEPIGGTAAIALDFGSHTKDQSVFFDRRDSWLVSLID